MDKTLTKGLLLLETLAYETSPMGVADLAREHSWTKSNVHRLLQTLVSRGYVTSENGKYSAGIKLWQIGSQIIRRVDVRNVARPFLEKLAAVTFETVHLSMLDGNHVIYLDKIESPQPVRAYSEIGGSAPAHCVATGKVLLAHQPAEVVAEILRHLKRHTAQTIIDPDKFGDELQTIRDCGHAINKGEWKDRVYGVAAPIRDSRNVVVAAVGISGPADRLTGAVVRKFVPLVCDAARNASTQMGASVSY
jgi:DNA-binding IclR family transcriptional regulator